MQLTRLVLAGASALFFSAAASAADLSVTVVGEDGKPLADAVVYLDSAAAKGLARPLQNVEMAQAARKFMPPVAVVTTGTAVMFPNKDTVRHHVYSFSPAKTFDLKLYSGTPSSPVVFDKPGIVNIGCNIHDQMQSWIVVLETPYFAKTDAAGVARLTGVPAGSYSLHGWQQRLPVNAAPSEQRLAVGATGQDIKITLKGLDN